MRHLVCPSCALASFAVFLVLVGACGPGAEPTRVEGGGLTLEARLEPAAPRSGENRMEIRVMGSDGEPVPDAEVEVSVVMPAMGAMAGMGGPARVESMGDGRHQAAFKLGMEGTWRVAIHARDGAGHTLAAEGSLITGHEGLRLSSRGGSDAAAGATHDTATPHPGEVTVDVARRQRLGVRTAEVRREPFGVNVRALGIVGYDQGAIHDVAPRVRGFVGEVRVPAVGEAVSRGDLLFTLYSPDLLAAQKEYLAALGAQRAGSSAGVPRGEAVARAAEGRLRLWGMAPVDIEHLAATGTPLEYVPFRAPTSGVVLEKNVVEGTGTESGERLFRIASIDRVWIEAELYEADLALVKVGAPARITLSYLPGEELEGRVSLLTPSVDAETRTARARVELDNPGRALLPGMYATVELRRELGERVVVPASAVLYAGDRRFVFVDAGEGRLRPQAVQTGHRDGERLEVLSGLEAGQWIVVSGNYLIASESRLGSALEQW